MAPDCLILLQGILFTALLTAASVIDVKKQLIPDSVCLGIALTGLLTFSPEKLLGILTSVILFGIALWLGGLEGGDIKYTAAVGLVLGLHKSMAGIILGFTAMLMFHAIHTLIQKISGGGVRKSYPLAPFFSLGCLTAYFFFKEEHSMSFLKNRTVLGVICIVLSLIICFALTPLFNQSASQKTTIVRVLKDIQSGDRITKDMVQIVEVGGYNLPENVMKKADSVIGKYAKADLLPGDCILTAKLSDSPAVENAYLYSLDGTKQAISVTIKSFAEGLSGKLASGDIVSVIAPDYKKQGSTVIPTELTYVKVIGVTTSSGCDTDQSGTKTGQASSTNTDNERQLPATVTLLVSPEQAKILAELDSEGKLHLSLVYRGTKEEAEKFLSVQDKLLEAMYPEPSRSQSSTSSTGGGASADNSVGRALSSDSTANGITKSQRTNEESEGR